MNKKRVPIVIYFLPHIALTLFGRTYKSTLKLENQRELSVKITANWVEVTHTNKPGQIAKIPMHAIQMILFQE